MYAVAVSQKKKKKKTRARKGKDEERTYSGHTMTRLSFQNIDTFCQKSTRVVDNELVKKGEEESEKTERCS